MLIYIITTCTRERVLISTRVDVLILRDRSERSVVQEREKKDKRERRNDKRERRNDKEKRD